MPELKYGAYNSMMVRKFGAKCATFRDMVKKDPAERVDAE